MYHRKELLEIVNCSEYELKKVLKELGLEQKKFSDADVKKIKENLKQKELRIKRIAKLTVALGFIIVLILFSLSIILLGNINPQ